MSDKKYYTFEEAAEKLGKTAEELNQMVQRGELRRFQAGKTWQFRTQDVEGLLGGPSGSSDALPIDVTPPATGDDVVFDFGTPSTSDTGRLKAGGSGSIKPGSSMRLPGAQVTSDSDVRQTVAGAEDIQVSGLGSSSKIASGSNLAPKSGTTKRKTGLSAVDRADSGVRLVPIGDDDSDSDVKVVPTSSGDTTTPAAPSDSSGMMLDLGDASRGGGVISVGGPELLLTEEINIDSDFEVSAAPPPASDNPPSSGKLVTKPSSKLGKDAGATANVPASGPGSSGKLATKPSSKLGKDTGATANVAATAPGSSGNLTAKPGSKIAKDPSSSGKLLNDPASSKKTRIQAPPKSGIPAPPPADLGGGSSPFELSEADLELPSGFMQGVIAPSQQPAEKKKPKTSPPPFELTEEEVALGEPGSGKNKPGASGVNLQKPADSGISLEKEPSGSHDQIEFELNLDDEASGTGGPPSKPKTSLQSVSPPAVDSSSEFELTLDEGGGLAPIDAEAPAGTDSEKDIFETDFEMPALEDESGFEPVALDSEDTDLESSDFDLALSDDESGSGPIEVDNSGSAVVDLDEAEAKADEGQKTIVRMRKSKLAKESLQETAEAEVSADESFDGLGSGEDTDEVEAESEEEEAPARPLATVAAAPTSWGIAPAVLMMFCVGPMFLAAIMSFELLNGMWGYQQPAKPTGPLVQFFMDQMGLGGGKK
jgi:excisionase family DNA binding protein